MARPRLDDEERRARTVGVRVTAAEAGELRERAQAARLSMGAYLRHRALGQWARMAAELRLGASCSKRRRFLWRPTGKEARYIEELFPRTDTSDFVGSLRCTAPGEGVFTGVAVELDASNQIFTTLPVVPVPEMQDQE